MANRDQLHGDDTGLVTLFARAPQLCAGALAGLGSALWLNVVGPFTGLVAAWGSLVLVNALAIAVVVALAMLVTTAGTLLAVDWRADVASRQAWAEIDVAAVEFRLPAGRVASSQIDPRYLTATDSGPLRSVFGAHCFAPLATELGAVSCSTRIVVGSDGSTPPVEPESAPTSGRKISTVAASDVALVDPTYQRTAAASPGQEPLIVASSRVLRQVSRAKPAVRLVANGGAWPEWLTSGRCILTHAPSDGTIADIIVLGGDPGDRDRRERSAGGSIIGGAESPNCRGPPSVVGQRSGAREIPPRKLSVEGASQVHTGGTLPTGDPLVVDNLGHQVHICAAELGVIETYLDRALQDLLGSGAAAPHRGKSRAIS